MKTTNFLEQLELLEVSEKTSLEIASAVALKLEKERDHLLQWKREALEVFNEWERVWMVAGEPGRLGSSKATAVKEYILGLQRKVAERPKKQVKGESPQDRTTEVSDEILKAVEDEVGMGADAWDCVSAKEVILAAWKFKPKDQG